MFNSSLLEQIKKEVAEFFQKATFEIEASSFDLYQETIFINIKSKEPQILIGEKGETLLAIQRLLKAIIKKKLNLEKAFYLDIDINDYKRKKSVYLRELAKEAAQEVALSKKEKILPPMSAYERRIVHMELANKPNVTTESIGQEPERRVVIRPFP